MFGTPLQQMIFWDKIKRLMMKVVLPIAIAVLLIVSGGYWLKKASLKLPKPVNKQWLKTTSVSTEQIYKMIVSGDYDTAITKLNQRLKTNPEDASLKNLYSLLMDELKVDSKFHYLPAQKRFVTAKTPSDTLILTSNDPYYLTTYASDYCYLYIFQLNSSGVLKQLFPGKDIPTPNPIPPGPLRIPNDANWFSLDDIPGTEKIYLVASRWRQEGLEELTARLNAERELTYKRDLTEKLVSHLIHNDQVTDKLPGLVFGMYQFKHR
ncbi:MAG: DUF4384 domain-containing protein [bacterium]